MSGTITDSKGREAPEELDGVDLTSQSECPACGGDTLYIEEPAGYFSCGDCWSLWSGDPENASLVDYIDLSQNTDESDGGNR